MGAEAAILQTNFQDVLTRLENRINSSTAGASKNLNAVFGDVDDDLYAFLLQKDYDNFEAVKALLPDWASDEIRRNSTGEFSMHDSVKEALLFWKLVKEEFRKLNSKPLETCRVVDYGAGWGRITRFCAKDVIQTELYAVEPNPVFCGIFEETRVPGTLVRTDWESSQTLPVKDADLLISFSIYTHTSDKLARNIRDRWAEMMTPGGVVAFTVRPGAFLNSGEGEAARFTEPERNAAKDAYRRGELIYKPYPNEPDWGVTVAPMPYLTDLFGGEFRIVRSQFFFHNWTQMLVFMVKT